MEEWKYIEGTNKGYKISNFGKVYSLKTNKLMRIQTNVRFGYKQVYLRQNGGYKMYKIHRLVATHFIENIENKKEVNHKDGNKENNTVYNLEWCTRLENVRHAIKEGLWKFTESHRQALKKYNENRETKTVYMYTKTGEFIREFKSAVHAGNFVGSSKNNISACANNYKTAKSVKGYVFKYNPPATHQDGTVKGVYVYSLPDEKSE
jgi:hypothetical protein